jgi:CBS domain-containing protein
MTVKPTTVSPDATIGAVARALVQGAFNGVPVVAGSAFAGMVSRHDLLHLLVDWPGDAEG